MLTVAFWTVVLLFVSLQFGPFIGLLGYLNSGDSVWTLIGLFRDICLVVLVALALSMRAMGARSAPLLTSAKWALALAVCFMLFSLWSPSALNVAVLNLRRIVYLPLLFLVILLLPWTEGQVARMFRILVGTSVLVALFGLVERALPDAFWTELLRVDDYTAATSVARFGNIGFHEGGRFFNWDFEPWLGRPLRRLVSTYVEPTTFGAGMAAALSVLLARHARGHRVGWMVAVVALAGALTLSKAFLLYLLVLAAWRTLGWPGPTNIVSLVLAGLVFGSLLTKAGYTESTFEHASGLTEAVAHLMEGQWLGVGLGGAGNYGDQANDLGGESGLGNVIAQAGLLALLPLIWIHALAGDMARAAQARRDPGAPWLAAWLLFWMLSFLFSASSLGVGGNALGFAALALYLHPASAPLRLAAQPGQAQR
jgi:hypothetical protein